MIPTTMLDNLSLRLKLLLLSGLAMGALVAAVITGMVGIRSGVHGVDEIGHHRLPSVIALQALKEAQTGLKSSTYEAGLWENDNEAQDQFTSIARDKQQIWTQVEAAWKQYERLPRSVEETELWDRFVKEWAVWRGFDGQITELIRALAANKDAARQKELFQKYFALGGQQRQSYLAAEKLLNEVVDLNARRVATETQAAVAATRLAQYIMLGVGISAIIVTSLLAFLVTLSIMKQMGGEPGTAVRIARGIAAGNLDVAIPVNPDDDTSLLAAMKAMQDQLLMVVSEIRDLVGQAAQGDFRGRIDVNGKHGFGREIGDGLNSLVSMTDAGLSDIMRVSQALSAGDLSLSIDKRYLGQFGETIAAINTTVFVLKEVVDDVRRVVDAAARGDFNQAIDTSTRHGYAKTLADLLNSLNITANDALSDISRAAHGLADGDLSVRIDQAYPGLFGKTAQDINSTIASLRELVGEIQEASGTIKAAVSDIASGNANLAKRTDAEAHSLRDTARRMAELNVTVKQNVSHATQANAHALHSADIAARGGARVKHVVETMSAIQVSSRRMADIVGVIDGIAFQTNILALNAAVEAARAGVQGRGFAVVATEVRALSQRSAAAAKEIKALIDDSLGKVADGGLLVEEAGATMDEVVESFQQVVKLVTEIASAGHAQSNDIEEVTRALASMDEVTRQNAALVEHAVGATESLGGQAAALVGAVGRFNLASAGMSVGAIEVVAVRPLRTSAGLASKPLPAPRHQLLSLSR